MFLKENILINIPILLPRNINKWPIKALTQVYSTLKFWKGGRIEIKIQGERML